MGIDGDQAFVNLGDPVTVGGGLGLVEQGGPLAIGCQNAVDERDGSLGRFLGQPPGPPSVASIAAATSQKNAPLGVIEALQRFCTQQRSRSFSHSPSEMPSSLRVTICV